MALLILQGGYSGLKPGRGLISTVSETLALANNVPRPAAGGLGGRVRVRVRVLGVGR